MAILRRIREYWMRRKYRHILEIQRKAFGVDSLRLATAAIEANGFLKKDMEYLNLFQRFVQATRIRSLDSFVSDNRELRLGIGLFFYGATSDVAQRDGLTNFQTQYLIEHVLLMLGHSKPVAAEVAEGFVCGEIIADPIARQAYQCGVRAMEQWLSGDHDGPEKAIRSVIFESG